ncbi:serine hydrolase domain-containing protein [Candidatus Latescibacterota bacterium]
MHRNTIILLYITLVIFSLFNHSCDIPNVNFSEVDGLFTEAVNSKNVPGVVAIVADKKEILYHNAFGKMDVKSDIEMGKNALFDIASMTKAFTTIGIMMLYERGKFELNDPVADFIPSLKNKQVLKSVDPTDSTYSTVNLKSYITIRQLLTHTSGYGYFFLSDPLAKIMRKTPMAWKDLPLLQQPGEKWTYGAGTEILGDLIEAVSGETLDVFFEENLFDPLGMTDTFYNIPEDKFNRLVTFHRRSEDGNLSESEKVMPNQRSIPNGGHGIYTTATDYMKLLQMLLNEGEANGKRLVSSETIKLMTTNQIGDMTMGPVISSNRSFTNDFSFIDGHDRFGFGFLIEANPKPNMRSLGSYGWVGLFNTYFWVDPKKEIAAILFTRILPFCDDKVLNLYNEFESMVYESL